MKTSRRARIHHTNNFNLPYDIRATLKLARQRDVPMKMPGGDTAIVDREKLTSYCLNPEHPRGKHKARVFAAALGFTTENAEQLRAALLTAAATADAEPAASDQFGDRYVIELQIRGP